MTEARATGPQEPTGMFIVEQATVFRAGGRRWFTQKTAIKAYAAAKFRAKHPCECEQGDYASGDPGFNCGVHDLRERVLPRYLRVLNKRLAEGKANR
jgi:hypothetical protein